MRWNSLPWKTLPRRTLLTSALTTTGVLLLGTPARATDPARVGVELAGTEVRAQRHRLRLRLDQPAGAEHGTGAGVPLTLTGRAGQAVTAVVASTTGHTALGATRTGPGQRELPVEIARNGTATVWVAPRRVGSPGVPADLVTVRTASGELPVEVWIEPVGGQWRPAGPGDTPLDLGIVATHAALVTGAGSPEVVMWSPARMRNPDGGPMPDPRRPSEWLWNFWAMEDVEVRALATDTLRTRDRDMAADGVTVRRNTFCAGNAHLPDGRLLVVGGHLTPTDNHNGGYLHVYDAAAPAGWRELTAQLVPQRWYPTVTALPDGRMLITSGAQQILRRDDEIDLGPNGYWNTINNDYRIFDPGTEQLLDPGPVSLVDEVELAADDQRLATYPSVFVLPADDPDGTVVALAETTRAWLYTYQPDQPAPLSRVDRVYHMSTQGSRSYPTYGAMVLLPLTAGEPEARILAVGGKHETNRDYRSLAADQPATATAELLRLDLSRPLTDQPGWQLTQDLSTPRVLCDATLLADGTVLVSGGAQQGWGDLNSEPVLACELFDPQSETFQPAAPAGTERRYHSTALLQPDGTVLKAGSTGGFGEDRNPDGYVWMRPRTDAERYYPPYLFRGPRPLIVHIDPDDGGGVGYDRELTVIAAGDSLDPQARVAVIRAGSTTHGNDMDQRYVWLEVTGHEQQANWTITARTPANPAAAPPGDYLLVVVDGIGVPSEARPIRLTGR